MLIKNWFSYFVLFLVCCQCWGEESGDGGSGAGETAEGSTSDSGESSADGGTEEAAAESPAAPESGGAAPAPAPAPTTAATTTIAPLDRPCVCLGDPDLVSNQTINAKVLKVCRDNAPSRLTSEGRGRMAERYRCGTRTPENPRWTWDSVCNCTAKEGPTAVAEKGFLLQSVIKDQDAIFRWETYNKIDKKTGDLYNTLDNPSSKEFNELRKKIETRFDTQFSLSATAVSKGFVRTAVISIVKGEGTNVDTTTTTSTTTTTTATSTTTTTVAARRRRQATTTTTTTTTTTIYYKSNYIDFLIETQFMDNSTTITDFQGMYNSDVIPNIPGLEVADLPAPTCKNDNLTNTMPDLMESMTHNKPIIMLNRTWMCPGSEVLHMVKVTVPCLITATNETVELSKNVCSNETLGVDTTLNDKCTNDKAGTPDAATISGQLPLKIGNTYVEYDSVELEYSQDIEITCKDPLMRPSFDAYDLDPYDGKITATCQIDGTYSVRTTQLAQCKVVCDQYTIPTPDTEAGLKFKGVIRKGNGNGQLEKQEDMVPEAFIWEGDHLVYECEEPQYGIRGGVDTVLDMYTCVPETATYNTPRGLNTASKEDQEPWPVCQPQVYMIINAAELVLIKFDFKISNRYKLIRYEDDDAAASVKVGPNHLINWTLPIVAGGIITILFVLLCARNDSLICSICAAKERKGFIKDDEDA